MVVQMLLSHPDVACYGEIFNPDRLVDGGVEITPEVLERLYSVGVTLSWKQQKASSSIRMLLTPHGGACHAVGFKILKRQWTDCPATRFLSEQSEIDVISVRRLNVLATTVSAYTAAKRSVYNSSRPSDAVTEAIEIRLDDLARWADGEQEWQETVGRAFAGHRQLDVTYEDLVAPDSDVGVRLVRFLELPERSLSTDTVKLGLPLSKAISNWAELAAEARGTRLERYFTDNPITPGRDHG